MSSLIKSYHLIIINIFLFILIIKNSSAQSQEKFLDSNFEESKKEIPFFRKLNFFEDSIKVCKRSSEDLRKYYETGDTQYVKFYENKVNDENPPDYILSLIDYLSDEGDSKENLKKYINHHILSILFLVVSLACIPGWITCCACKICNCCFCECCKKHQCKLPFFIIVSIMNAEIIIFSIFGFIQTNDLFLEISNAECSMLTFINDILEGEKKNSLPKWGNIDSIINLLEETSNKVKEIAPNTEHIEDQKDNYVSAKNNFLDDLGTDCNSIYEDNIYRYTYNSINYIFDIVKKFGKKNSEGTFEGYYAEKWIEEANFSDDVEQSYTVIDKIVKSNVENEMKVAKSYIKLVKSGIEDIKDMIGEKIIKNSENIDSYGKKIFSLIFAVLFVFSIINEIILIFLYCFSCKKCICTYCCVNCCMKVLIHIFWNILALFMIVIFLYGSLMIFVGTLGNDLLYSFSFILSEKNLQSDYPKIVGEGGDTLNICINHNGVITQKLGIKSDLENIDKLKKLTYNIYSLINIINAKSDSGQDNVYQELINEINSKLSNNDFEFVEINSSGDERKLNLKSTILSLNSQLQTCGINESWSFSCYQDFETNPDSNCDSSPTHDEIKCYNPSLCYNDINTKYSSTSCIDAKNSGQIINKIFSCINHLENTGNPNNIQIIGGSVRTKYGTYLNSVKSALNNYPSYYSSLIELYDEFVGNGSIMGFINCAFMGKNFQILSNYLKNVEKKFKTLGIFVLATGIAMAISISFTIVLVIIFNSTINFRENIFEDIKSLPKRYQFRYDNPISQVYPVSTTKQII